MFPGIKTFFDWWAIKKILQNDHWYNPLLNECYSLLMSLGGANIMPKAQFSSRPTLPHGLSGIFISSGSRIGSNAVIFQQVTIGSITTIDSSHRGSPQIGDDCYIGAGAKVLGR